MNIDISIDEYIGRKVVKLRKEKKILQNELAKQLGMSGMGLSHLENGNRSWKPSHLQKLSSIFNVNITFFCE